MYHAKIKHIDVRFHKINELISFDKLLFKKVRTSKNTTEKY